MQDLLALDHKTSSSLLCSSKKLDAFKNSIRKTPRASDIKSLQPFHAQDLFGIGRTQQDASRLPTRSQIAATGSIFQASPDNDIAGDGLHVQYVAGRLRAMFSRPSRFISQNRLKFGTARNNDPNIPLFENTMRSGLR
ncbi:hypothetical protein B0H13DRAFT_2276106 [Mycena leptocephala]|nr:hypothetical protein B0H13DRAFT_2279729 [Mycena leptocephala]KAJ7896453.1 hypothetical protein B0H13DRAFT_2276106 [Mycena leptocephala]